MDFVQGHEKVTAIFGRWPSFHDGEVEAFSLEWNNIGLNTRLLIRGWETTGEVDEQGYCRLHKHTLVDMLFEGCTNLRVEADEGTLNIVFGLRIDHEKGSDTPLVVALHGIGGIEGSFRCHRAAVVTATPYQPSDGPM